MNSAFVAGVDFTISGRNCRDQDDKQGQSFPGGRAAVLSDVARMSPGKGQERGRERYFVYPGPLKSAGTHAHIDGSGQMVRPDGAVRLCGKAGRVSRWVIERRCDYGIVRHSIVVDRWSYGRHQVIGAPGRDGMELLVGMRSLLAMAVTDRKISPDDGFDRRMTKSNHGAKPWCQTVM
ncbi:hypothetical protein [Thalassospira povalilytica]|uniref:Uncharacterized protein n=1 Tax=Thalassospira povalilytica TaxID=732237 RepID=A0A8I1MAC5_9PROT|nr:hypothetical protein [Thalassospira povalilytica]MBN8197969.1 hypothetical protein [Thalassospira povalilytica]